MTRNTDLRHDPGFAVVPGAQPLVDALHKLDIEISSMPLNSVRERMGSTLSVDEDVRVICITLEDRQACERFMLKQLMRMIDLTVLPEIMPIAAFDQRDGHVLLCFMGAVGMATLN